MQLFRLLDQFVKAPRDTGSIVPSSQALARALLNDAEISRWSTVVEFGPGTGVFTEHLVNMVPENAVFFAMEINPFLARQARLRCPQAQVHTASATDIVEYLGRHGLRHCDCVVSSLPWGSLKPALQDAIFAAIMDALPSGGRFVTFTYAGVPFMPAGRAFKERLVSNFSDVKTSPIIWGNFPPAMVYSCTR